MSDFGLRGEDLRLWLAEKLSPSLLIYSADALEQRWLRHARRIGTLPDAVSAEELIQDPVQKDALLCALIDPLAKADEGHSSPLIAAALEERALFKRQVLEGGPARVWIVGCGDGSDVFRLALALADVFGVPGQLERAALWEPMRDGVQASAGLGGASLVNDAGEAFSERPQALASAQRLRIFGTDLENPLLRRAASGRLSSALTSELDEGSRARFLWRDGGDLRVHPRVRETIVFASHDFRRDPPLARIGLLVIRAPLADFAPEVLGALRTLVQFALHPGGLLWIDGSLPPGLAADFEGSPFHRFLYRRKWSEGGEATFGMRRTARPSPLGWRSTRAVAAPSSPGWQPGVLSRLSLALAAQTRTIAVHFDADFRVREVLPPTASAHFVEPKGPGQEDFGTLASPLIEPLGALMRRALVRFSASDGEADSLELSGFPLPPKGELFDLFLRVERGRDAEEFFLVARPSEERCPLGPSVNPEEWAESLAAERAAKVASDDLMAARVRELERLDREHAAESAELDSLLQAAHKREASHREGKESLEEVLAQCATAILTLDAELRLLATTGAVSEFLPILPTDVGRKLDEIRGEFLDVDLGALLPAIQESGLPRSILLTRKDERRIHVRITPLSAEHSASGGLALHLVDVTDALFSQSLAVRGEPWFLELLKRTEEVYWLRDAKTGQFIELSAGSRRVYGYSRQELLARSVTYERQIHPDDLSLFDAWLESARSGRAGTVEYRLKLPGGERWVSDRAYPISSKDEEARLVGLSQDITERKATEAALAAAVEALEQQAHRDPLTGLYNRRGLEKALGRELERARRQGNRVSAILVDCDDFKAINDTLGHAAGDVALRFIADQLGRALRMTDCLGRVGGDEFLALLPDTREAEAWNLAERLRLSLVENAIRVGSGTLPITASLGVAAVPENVLSLEEVIAETQHALSRSKKTGKNRVSLSGSTDPYGAEDYGVFDRVLTNGEGIEVWAQTIVGLQDQRVAGTEFLIRGPVGPYRSPSDLFRIAMERNGLTNLDLRCFRKSLEASREVTTAGFLHLNLLPSTLLELDLDKIAGYFAMVPDRQRFVVEISEQQFIGDPHYLVPAVQALKSLGVGVAIDDVGFGRSSLESLVVLEPDVIKIDRGFVDGVANDSERRRGLQRLLAVANHLSPLIIAEGIETAVDYEVVRDLGVPFGQGWFWSRAEPVKAHAN